MMNALSFWLHVKLFYRIVSYEILDLQLFWESSLQWEEIFSHSCCVYCSFYCCLWWRNIQTCILWYFVSVVHQGTAKIVVILLNGETCRIRNVPGNFLMMFLKVWKTGPSMLMHTGLEGEGCLLCSRLVSLVMAGNSWIEYLVSHFVKVACDACCIIDWNQYFRWKRPLIQMKIFYCTLVSFFLDCLLLSV